MSTDKEKYREIKAISLLLFALRDMSDMTQKVLAQNAGVSVATIAKLEADQPENLPRPQTLTSILEVYDISYPDFTKSIDELKSMGLSSANATEIANALHKKSKSADNKVKTPVNSEDLDTFDDASYFEKLLDFAGRIPFVNDAVSSYFSMRDPRTSLAIKATLASALVYFVSPIDVIPDVVPILGLTDDAGVVMAAVALAGSAITSVHRKRAKQLLTKMHLDADS